MHRITLTATLLAAGLSAVPAGAQPTKLSQHPRDGELCQIDFPAGSARILSADAPDKLGEVAGWAKDNPDGVIVVDGYADRAGEGRGGEEALAMDRAKAVRDDLVAAGVDPQRVVIAAFGAGPGGHVTVWVSHQDVDAVIARVNAGGPSAVMWGNQEVPPLGGP
jgi:OmpA family